MSILRFIALTVSVFTLGILNLFSIPASPDPIKIKQADGSEITIYLRGDEFFHYQTSLDGYLLCQNNRGILEYAQKDITGNIIATGLKAKEIEDRTISDKKILQTLDKSLDFRSISQTNRSFRIPTNATKTDKNAFPLVGSPKSLVILVNFKDKSFTTTNPLLSFTNLLNQQAYNANGGTGSAKDYFKESSNGAFTPQFEVVGPFTLPQDMLYYGENVSDNDKNPRQMVVDACKLADDAGVDFTQYDTDSDGIVDNVFIYYAGNNEAEGASANTIWPHRWTLSNKNSKFDNKIIYDYACTSELKGTGTTMCGIGTFCHEFGHVLGLVDYYATNGAKHHTLSNWNIMDGGAYLNQGRTPPTYSAYDRFFLNWLQPVELKTGQNVELPSLISSNKAYLITQNGNHNLNGANPTPVEFFTLENRQATGFDSFLPNTGLLITRIYYNESSWSDNGPNNSESSMGVDIMEADGIASSASLAGDPFPGATNKTSYTPVLRNGTVVNKPLTYIKKESNGNITFRFMGGGDVPMITTLSSFNEFNTVHGTPSTYQIIKIYGKRLTSNLNIAFSQNLHFEMRLQSESDNNWRKTISLSPINSIVDTTIVLVRYNPIEPSYDNIHDDNIILTSLDAETIQLNLLAKSTRPVYVVKPDAIAATDVTLGSFQANWNAVFDASGYYLTLYSLSDGQSEMKETFRNGINPSLGWTIMADAITTSKTYSGDSIPAIWLKKTGDYIETEKYNLASSGISFYLKSMLAENSKLLVEAWNGTQWELIDEIITTTSLTATKSYNFTIDKNYIQFRFNYTQVSGQLAIDDISVKFSQVIDFIATNKWVTTNSFLAENLVSNRDHFYKVKASDRTLTEDKKLILYENITDFSNLVSVKTLEDTNIKRLRVEKMESDGTVFVFIPSVDDNLYIYNFAGQLVNLIKPNSLKINISEILTRKQPYILVSGGRSTKIYL